jgi:hypothetical protein
MGTWRRIQMMRDNAEHVLEHRYRKLPGIGI